jgi:serine phosphatase RsbU (regulator of sigma subunit)
MNIKIKSKLFFSFILLCFFSLLIAIVSIWMNRQKENFEAQLKTLNEIHLLSMESYKLQQEFLLNETAKIDFYKYGNSLKLKEHSEITTRIIDKLALVRHNTYSKQLFNIDSISQILLEQFNYKDIFEEVVVQIKAKGFQDYGIEGKMRNEAHALMKIESLDQVNILMLRRNEKDFIIRKDLKYVEQFKSIVNKVSNEINKSELLSIGQKKEISSQLWAYSSSFYMLVNAECLLFGKKSGEGLIGKLGAKHNRIVSQIVQQKEYAEIMEIKIFNRMLLISLACILLILVMAFIFSYRLANELSKPLVNLNQNINEYIKSKFSQLPKMKMRHSKDEISELSDNFYKMANEITSYIKLFEEKVEERTYEINMQSDEILSQKIKIFRQYNELIAKTDALQIQQDLTMEKNKNILDSIYYAERIQRSIMPSGTSFKNILPNSFVFFQPRDIVSGDFYFLHEKGNKVFFAVADCTGHGVPGAFVSIIGMHAIHRALNEFGLEKPSEILNMVNNLVVKNMSNNAETIIDDGMDIAFCCYDKVTHELEFAGAHMPMWIVSECDAELDNDMNDSSVTTYVKQNNSKYAIKELRADNQPIGHFLKRIPFTNHTIQLQKGDTIYLFSDGYADQFGGVNGKKFKYSKLKELLLSIQSFPIEMQQVHIKETFRIWKGDFEQLDDICVFGLKV